MVLSHSDLPSEQPESHGSGQLHCSHKPFDKASLWQSYVCSRSPSECLKPMRPHICAGTELGQGGSG